MVPSYLSQRGAIGDGNSFKNHMAVHSLRDISSYDVKKVKFTDENQEPEAASKKQQRVELKAKKVNEIEKKKAGLLSFFDLNESEPVGKLAKQLAQ
jgi:hypothetical protein